MRSGVSDIRSRFSGFEFRVLGVGVEADCLLKEILGVVLLEELYGVVRLDVCRVEGVGFRVKGYKV